MNKPTRLLLALAAAVLLLTSCGENDYTQELRDIDSRLKTIEAKLSSAPETMPNEVSPGVPYYDASDTIPDSMIIVPGPLVNGSRYVACPIAITQSGCHANWVDYGLSPTSALSVLDISNGTTLCAVDRLSGSYTEYSVMSDVTYSGSIPILDVQINARGAADTRSIPAALLGLTPLPGSVVATSERITLSFPGMCSAYLDTVGVDFSAEEQREAAEACADCDDTFGDEGNTGIEGGTSD